MNRLAILMDILSGRDLKQLRSHEKVLNDYESRLTTLEHRQELRDTFRRVAGGGR